jgi:UDP-glucuronate 4-epimerase
MKILITGSAGFIGFHLVKKLMEQNNTEVTGIDNINNYYNVDLKYTRLKNSGINKEKVQDGAPVKSSSCPQYTFYKADIANYAELDNLFKTHAFDYVIHLAAQAGIRYSMDNPHAYIQSNVAGFTNILECCRHHRIKHLIYASSSSVYGMNHAVPFSESDDTNHPISIYAATKKSNELLAHSYSHLFCLPTTGVRLFTVYGPWGRPDMAPMLFAGAICKNQPINVFNQGNMSRDFTYVDDIVNAIVRLIPCIPDNGLEHPCYRVFNIGNARPVKLMDFISVLERNIGKKAKVNLLPMQPGDVPNTYANTSLLEKLTGYTSNVSIEEGIPVFVEWFNTWMRDDAV